MEYEMHCCMPQMWHHHRQNPDESSSVTPDFLQDDPLEHRLHCHTSNCLQCRCDSGYMPSSNSERNHSQLDHRGSIAHRKRHDDVTNCQEDVTLSSYDCEHCQYCVGTLNCSSSTHSDHVPSVSLNRVCSCSSSPVNLQQPTTATRGRLNCPRWKFALATAIQRFMSRFSGRLRQSQRRPLLRSSSVHGWERMTSFLYTILTVITFCLSFLPVTDACSSRSTPKPRPPSPTLRPNITIQTYTCPAEYDAHYCLNGATCFTVKIGESILYNCECAEGYMGQRCEFKDLDGSYLPSKQRAMLEQAGLTSGAAIIVVIVVIVCFYLYVRSRRKFEISQRLSRDVPDGMEYIGYENERMPFSGSYPSFNHSHHPHHHSYHRPPTTYHQPHPQQHQQLPYYGGEVCLGTEQESAPPTPISQVYPKNADPPPDHTSTP